jgi:hypothetical protein
VATDQSVPAAGYKYVLLNQKGKVINKGTSNVRIRSSIPVICLTISIFFILLGITG